MKGNINRLQLYHVCVFTNHLLSLIHCTSLLLTKWFILWIWLWSSWYNDSLVRFVLELSSTIKFASDDADANGVWSLLLLSKIPDTETVAI